MTSPGGQTAVRAALIRLDSIIVRLTEAPEASLPECEQDLAATVELLQPLTAAQRVGEHGPALRGKIQMVRRLLGQALEFRIRITAATLGASSGYNAQGTSALEIEAHHWSLRG